MSNDSQSSPLLFHHFCSREILSGSYSFRAVGLVQEGVPCEHSRVVATLLATKEDAHLDGYLRFLAPARSVYAVGIDD